jgi:hypothetical protein
MSPVDIGIGQAEHVVQSVQKGGGFKPPRGGGIENIPHEHLIYHEKEKRIYEKRCDIPLFADQFFQGVDQRFQHLDFLCRNGVKTDERGPAVCYIGIRVILNCRTGFLKNNAMSTRYEILKRIFPARVYSWCWPLMYIS